MIGKALHERSFEEQAWNVCLMFLAGKQWLTYDRNISQHLTAKASQGGATKITVNLLLNIYRNLLAKMTLSYPSVVVLPASPSSEDIAKAKASETALRYYWSQAHMKDVIEKALEWLLSCGTAAFHSYYDPGKKSVVTKVVSPFDLLMEPGVPTVEECQWFGIRTFEPIEQLVEAYPDHEDAIRGASPNSGNKSYPEELEDRAEVVEIYWRDGRHAIVVGSTYLFQEEKHPLPVMPIQIIKYTNIPRRPWGLGLLAPVLDLQWLYNKARSQVLENIELMSNPKWLVPKTAGVSKNAITNRPGEKIFYNAAGGKPQMMQGVPIPQYVMDNIKTLQMEMQDVAGVHNISLGKRAIGVTSGKAIQALSEQDSSQLQVTQSAVERAVTEMARTVLLLMRVYYNEAKMARMLDATGQVIFTEIKNTDLVDDPEIFIEAGSLFRDEAQDRDAKLLELLQLGLITKEVAMQELSFRTGNSFITQKVQAIAHAKDMLEACKRGYEIEIFRSDDVEAFVKVFGDFMREREYYELPEDVQTYIRDVYVALVNANVPPGDYDTGRKRREDKRQRRYYNSRRMSRQSRALCRGHRGVCRL